MQVLCCKFYAAFTKFKVEGIRDFLKEVLDDAERQTTVNEAILNCLYEAQVPSLCQYVAVVMKKRLEVTHTLSPLYCMVVGYFLHCISLTPGGGKFHIEFGGNDLDEYRCGYLVNELKKCECGQLSLSLSGTGPWAETASLLVPMLQRNCISELSLSIKDFSGSGFGQLVQCLLADSSMIPLIFLNFRRSDRHSIIPPEGARELADFLAVNSTLQELNLKRYRIPPEGMRALADSLTKNSTLRTLNLAYCTIPPGGISALADSLTKNSTLQTLNLSGCIIPPEGTRALADSLTKNSTLQTLNLSCCTIPPEGISALADSLTKNSTLQTLNLSGCTIPAEGIRALADSLTKNSTLQTLNLSGCIIPSEGIRALADSLTKNSTLQTLDLSYCRIPPEGISTLADSLTKNSTIQTLNLLGCTIPPEGIRALADSLNSSDIGSIMVRNAAR